MMMKSTGAGGFSRLAAARVAVFGQGSLAHIVRVEPRRVMKLALLFSLWILLPLCLLIAVQPQIDLSHAPGLPLTRQAAMWSVLCAVLAMIMSLALAFSIARQQALANALERAIDGLPLQFAYIDADRCYRFNNRAHLETCADPVRALVGRSVQEVLGDVTYQQVEPHLDQALSGHRVDFELRLPDGERIHDLSVSYLPDMSPEGKVRGLFVLADDVTLRKQAERRDKEQLLEFAHLSRLASIGEVAAEIAHQINQPLAAIAMFSSAAARTLAGGGDQSKVHGWLENINGQSKRASEVIGSLRRFVRPATMEPVVLDLNAALREVTSLLTQDAAARQVSLHLELAEVLPPVMATGILIEQVVFNLTRAAIQAAADPDRQGRVTVRSRADAGWVWFEVQGTRPTIDRHQVCDVPEVGTDVIDETGVGLSLTISRSIIEGFGGEVGCYGQESNDTFCYFSLPGCKP